MSQINFFNEDIDFILENSSIISNWITGIIEDNSFTISQLNYIICSDNYLLEINRTYLSHDYLTDIITFDYTEDGIISSEIYISVDRVRENAKNLGVGALDEMHRVIIHGVLHLCGYKDKSDLQSQEMRGKENYYLRKRDF